MTDAGTETADAAPGGFPVRLALRVLLMIAVVVALGAYAAPSWRALGDWQLPDNDDAMRVLSVQDWLGGQAWFDPRQHRLNPPEGGDIHWSRIADLPLALFMAPLVALFGDPLGAQMAAFAAPVALMGVFVALGIRAATALGGDNAFLPAIVFLIAAPASTIYFIPGRVDHHGLQLVFLVGAYAGLAAGGARAAALGGLCVAASIAVGLETLPMLALLIAWATLRWAVRGDEARGDTIGFGLGLGLGLPILYALTVAPERWLLPVTDAVGRGHVALCAVGGLGLAAAARWAGASPRSRIAALAGVAALVLPMLWAFTELRRHPYDGVDPLLTRLWLNNVSETAPFIRSKPGAVIAFALFPVIAAIAAAAGVAMTKGQQRDRWTLALLLVVAAAGLALFWQGRAAGQATAMASVAAAAFVALLWERRNARVAIIAACLIGPVVPGAVGGLIERAMEPKTQTYRTGGGAGCYGVAAFAELAKLPPGIVIAPVDMGARVLLGTRHSVMAAPYHRNNRGNLLSYRTFLMAPDEARASLDAMGARYVAICSRSAENAILARESRTGLMAMLKDGKAPDWLRPVPSPRGSDVRAWEIVRRPPAGGN